MSAAAGALVCLIASACTPSLNRSPAVLATEALVNPQARTIAITNFSTFAKATNAEGGVTLTSPAIALADACDELVLSWNIVAPSGSYASFELRALYPGLTTAYYNLGLWSMAPSLRRSIKAQRDAHGYVETDILKFSQPTTNIQIRITTAPHQLSRSLKMNLVAVTLANSTVPPVDHPPNRKAWGVTLAVPQRSQLAYAGGRGWCSPTAVSMVLAWWAFVLQQPNLDRDVPDVAAGVHDPNWPGTGNWPFNTAYAARAGTLRAYVVRLDGIHQLEGCIAEGTPIICSVDYPELKGAPAREPGGHLVVCVGFTNDGDVVVNDPWAPLQNGSYPVRKIFPRERFDRAWAHSRNTAYLIQPASAPLPGHTTVFPGGVD